MVISEILKSLNSDMKYLVLNEQSVDTLGLVDTDINQKLAIFIDDEKKIGNIKSNVSMIFTTENIKSKLNNQNCGFIITHNPRILFFKVHNFMEGNLQYDKESRHTDIDLSAKISPLSCISKNDVHIGKNVVIEQFVSIYSHVTIGDGSIIRAGATIGCMGFEFKRNDDSIMPIKHFGGVYLDRNIEVQNNTCIDRAVFPWDNTYIGENTKIDNLVHIGHAAKIQKNVLIAAHACIGGRTVIMPNTWVGIGSMIRNGIVIGSNARVNMGAVVTKSVLDNQSVTGNFAIDHQKFMANFKDTL